MATLPVGLKKPARSCGPCRKSKVKCDRKFPCSRCLRMRIPCEDPTTGGMEDTTAGLISICHMLPTLAAAPAFALCLSRYGPKELAVDKANSVMKVLAAVYRRKGCERLKRVVEALAQGLNADFEGLVRPRTEAEAAADRALLAGHFPFELKSPELRPEQALHPYAIELFKEPFTTMAAVLVGGEERVFVNEGWAKAFFEEETARQRLEEEGLRPTEIFAAIVHPDDRAFVVPLLDNCLFGCSDTLSESAHIFRCQSPRTQATFVTLARLRAIVTPEGYLCTVYSVQPLPYPADMVRVSMPVGGVVAGRHPWTEFIDQHERGEHSDMAAPISAGPSSAASVASGSSVGSSWSTRRHPRGTGGRRSGARRGGIQEEDEEEEDYDESGRESFWSSDVGRESFRESLYSEDGDDGGRESVLSVTAEEAARAVAALGVSDSTPRSSLGEDRPSGAAAAGAAAVLFHAGQHLSGGGGNGGDGAGGLRPPQPPV